MPRAFFVRTCIGALRERRFCDSTTTMIPVFYQSPAEYRAESMRVSPVWRVFAPIAVAIALVAIAYADPEWYRTYLQDERGFLEFLHALLPLGAAAIAGRLLLMPALRRDPFIAAWLAAILIGGIYLGGEEASWGQHYFGWQTPEQWAEINRQEETNLHNTSFWFDRFPRIVITVGAFVGGLVLPSIKLHRPDRIPQRFDFVVPPLGLRTLTVVMMVGEILGGLRETTDAIGDVLRFRPGEMQENFIVVFIFVCMLCLAGRAKRVGASQTSP